MDLRRGRLDALAAALALLLLTGVGAAYAQSFAATGYHTPVDSRGIRHGCPSDPG